MTPLRRWRGLAALLQDAVEAGSRAVARVHRETARRPFAVLERVPLVALPARSIHAIHDASVAGVHGAIRLVSRTLAGAAHVTLDVLERHGGAPGAAAGPIAPPAAPPPLATAAPPPLAAGRR